MTAANATAMNPAPKRIERPLLVCNNGVTTQPKPQTRGALETMKRDPDLIRQIALETEALKPFDHLTGLEGVDRALFAAHVGLMLEAGLVEARVQQYLSGNADAVVLRLTWAGHDFVEAARSDTLWAKAKKSVIANGAAWTLDLLKEWLKSEVKQGFPTLGKLA
jgi:Hypothetical protein (DUF2513)